MDLVGHRLAAANIVVNALVILMCAVWFTGCCQETLAVF